MNKADTRGFKKRPTTADISKIAQVGSEIAAGTSRMDPAPPAPVLAPAQGPSSYSGLQVGMVIEIPAGTAIPNPYNARHVNSQSRLDDLALKMQRDGQRVAALAYVNEKGAICLIDGHRRDSACRLANLMLRVEIHRAPKDNKELARWSRTANKDRDDQTPLDDALAWKKLLDDGVYSSQAELCREEGLDTTTVNRTLALADMPKTLIAMLADRPDLMTLRMLDALNRFHKAAEEVSDEDKSAALNLAEALIIEVDKESLSSRDVDQRRMALQRGPVSRKRSAHQTVTYKEGQAVIKRFAGQGRLVLEVTKVVNESRVELLEDRINDLIKEILDGGE